jgi:hypothetical protein
MNRSARVAHRSRSLILGGSGLVLVLLSGVACVPASAHPTGECRTNRIGVRGPTANASNVSFNETVFGCATARRTT